MSWNYTEVYERNNPFLQQMKRLDANVLYDIIELFINDHIRNDDRRFKHIFDSGLRSLNVQYDSNGDIEGITYYKSFYDSLSIVITPLSAKLCYKEEHRPEITMTSMDFHRFFELYCKILNV